MNEELLMKEAENARKNAYAPYSRFTVGAALLCRDGSVYTGCNVENASFGATNCAERTAFFKAVSDGKHSFSAIAIVGGKMEETVPNICAPCGICRQVMSEFCDASFQIFLRDGEKIRTFELGNLLPLAFLPKRLNED